MPTRRKCQIQVHGSRSMKCGNGKIQPDNFEYEYEKFLKLHFPEIGFETPESMKVAAEKWLEGLRPEQFEPPKTPEAEAVLGVLKSRFLEFIRLLDGNHAVLEPGGVVVHVSQAVDFYTKLLIWIGRNYAQLDGVDR